VKIDDQIKDMERLELRLKTMKRIVSLPVKHGKYGTAQMATAQHDVLDRRMTMLLAQNEDGEPQMSIRFDKINSSKPKKKI